MENYGLADSPPPRRMPDMDSRAYSHISSHHQYPVTSAFNKPKEFYYDTYSTAAAQSAPIRPKRAALVGDIPVGLKQVQSYPPAPASTSLGFGLGLGRYGNELPSPIDAEIQQTVLEMQQELAYVETSPDVEHFRHSIRLLKERCSKLENTVDPDWVEVDINKPIRVTKRILIPNFRHPTLNYVGRILGTKGVTLQNICKKYKAHISVMGSGSTKDPAKELELLNSGDPRFAHYASPLHVRIDIIAAAQVAHTRLAGLLNVFHKLLSPMKDVIIEGINDGTTVASKNSKVAVKNGSEEPEDDLLENELEEQLIADDVKAVSASIKRRAAQENGSATKVSRGGTTAGTSTRGGGRGGGGGFVPRMRHS